VSFEGRGREENEWKGERRKNLFFIWKLKKPTRKGNE